MPQVIAILLIIYVVIVWVIPLVIWIIKWIVAGIIWVWQVLLMPFLVYFTPAIIILVISAAIFFGGWIAVQNYFASLKIHINPAGSLEKLIKYYIISVLTLFLVTLYLSLAISSLWLSYQPGQQFVFYVANYYKSITFPAFQIDFLFAPEKVIFQENRTFHLGDEELTTSGWKSLDGNCFTARFDINHPIQKLTLKLEIWGFESRFNAIFLNGIKVGHLPYLRSDQKQQLKKWFQTQINLPTQIQRLNRKNELKICSGMLKGSDKDDLQIRKIRLIAK